jgi:hypothetical protein
MMMSFGEQPRMIVLVALIELGSAEDWYRKPV